MKRVDVAIVGAGTAGLNARRAALSAGATVALFDPGPHGTTCARVGCMPSKLLIAAAEIAHAGERGDAFGVHSEITVDPVAVMARVRRMRDAFVSHTNAGTDKLGAPIPTRPRFVGPHTLEADGERYEARAVVLATGSRPTIPGPWRAAGDALITNEGLFELERLPESLLVVGAGPVGLEMGQAMHRLGVRVTVLDVAGALGGLTDPELIATMRPALGLDMHLRHTLQGIEPVPGGVRVRFHGEHGEERDDVWQRVLVATGRAPRLDGLELGAAGLDPLPPIDPYTGRCGDSAVYFAGDVTHDRMLMHEAAHEGVIAGGNAARHPATTAAERKTPLGIVFTDPQIATVGSRGELVGRLDFSAQSRAKVLGRTAGQVQVYARRDGRLTGATIVGPEAEHLGHLMAWAVQAGFDVEQALSMPYYHPVLEEGLRSALEDLARQLKAG